MRYYLRVEGVNLDNFLYDTQDLSTIRGGGLLLLNAINEIEKKWKSELEPISTGASSGLFEFKTGCDEKKVVEEIRSFLNQGAYQHATFVVDKLLISNDDFISNKEKMLALNRFNQMQSPSVVFPGDSQEVCSIDMVRSVGENRWHDKKLISESVYQRREYGKKEKQKLYINQIQYYNENLSNNGEKLDEKVIKYNFVNDFEELSSDNDKGKLDHKMAVIYLDGNHFSAIQNKECQTKDAQKEFDTTVKKYRIEFLYALFQKINKEPNWISPKGNYRIETLLWGGDEIIWVAPAWKGWEVLSFFYEQSKNWKFKNNALTHAAGLVFCHHNAPIHRVRKLAEKLAEEAKKKSREENLFAYQVLESFDHITMDLDEFWESRLPGHKPILHGKIMGDYIKEFPNASKEISRGQIYRNVHHLLQGEEITFKDNIIKSLKKLTGIEATDPKEIKDKIAKHPVWLHLAELWDYLPSQTIIKEGAANA